MHPDPKAVSAFVSTNSICQGQQVPILWPLIFQTGHIISFAHTSFRWANLASHNAGVTVVIVGISNETSVTRKVYSLAEDGQVALKSVENINAYLVPSQNVYVSSSSRPLNGLPSMDYGSKPADGGYLSMSLQEKHDLHLTDDQHGFVLPYIGSAEYIDGKQRFCLWLNADSAKKAMANAAIAARVERVRQFRQKSTKRPTQEAAATPFAFVEVRYGKREKGAAPFIIPIHTSENRQSLPVGILPLGAVVSNAAFALYDAPLWNMALIASRLHLVWIATVCGKLGSGFITSR